MTPYLLRPTRLASLALLVLMLGVDEVTGLGLDSRPNFVLIMVDDLGIGDVGCYGNHTIRTPNIDRLALEGVKLSQHIAAAPLCTPSRAAFLTGRYALRSGLASSGRVPVLLFLAGSGGLPPTETTFAKQLQNLSLTHSPSLPGKWHLGVNCVSRGDHCHHPNQHGFHYFYGLPFTLFNNCVPGQPVDVLADVEQVLRSLSQLLGLALLTLVCLRALGLPSVSVGLLVALTCLTAGGVAVWYVPFCFLQTWNCIVMRNQEVVEQPLVMETLAERMLNEAQHFISRNAHQPFLLFFSLAHVHTPLFNSPAFAGKSRHGVYGDNVEEMDWIIGQVTETVDSLGLANNTMMYFTSDHGGHIEDPQRGGWNGIYKGGKVMGGWEGGIRVPRIFRWPGRLPAGRVVDQPTSLMDLYPTLRHLAQDTEADRPLDGHDLMPLLEGRSRRSEHQFMFHYCGSYLHAVRWQPPDCESLPPTQRTPASALLGPVTGGPRTKGPEHGVPNQMSWDHILWKPWLQPCCGTFPFCGCQDNSRPPG
ncbi:LOW QUALITY PROTEIN: arylsulfatase D-like [Gadus macrocephalus]|uniref:LOW QUALITY PROTEIN: arylsulfatase D-like n=1 Tax=Gadus macrocephalus TaxID=80720 RepID=UPI0028CBBF00|nr:LOW QUALITY PROTEIN: arylsulfatase D-like [Gadus macrocephalus]